MKLDPISMVEQLTDEHTQSDICTATGCATLKTFTRLYNLWVEPVSDGVLHSANMVIGWLDGHTACAFSPGAR